LHVGIVGGGIAGLATALALARSGHSTTVLESAPAIEDVGAGIQLTPNAMHALAALGLDAPARERGEEPETLDLRDGARDLLLSRLPLKGEMTRRFGAPYLVLRRADLQAVLLEAARGEPGIDIRLGRTVWGVEETPGGPRILCEGEAVAADLVVAADGVRSAVRRDFFGYPTAVPSGLTAWRRQGEDGGDLPPASTTLLLLPGAHAVIYPVSRSGLRNMVLIVHGGDRDPAALAERAAPALRPLVGGTAEWSRWPVLVNDARRAFASGRVALVGDAAHALPPTAAQGGAQALEDALTLAACLTAAPPEAALARFSRLRQKRLAAILAATRRNLWGYGLTGAFAVARNLTLRRVPPRLQYLHMAKVFGWRPEDSPK